MNIPNRVKQPAPGGHTILLKQIQLDFNGKICGENSTQLTVFSSIRPNSWCVWCEYQFNPMKRTGATSYTPAAMRGWLWWWRGAVFNCIGSIRWNVRASLRSISFVTLNSILFCRLDCANLEQKSMTSQFTMSSACRRWDGSELTKYIRPCK